MHGAPLRRDTPSSRTRKRTCIYPKQKVMYRVGKVDTGAALQQLRGRRNISVHCSVIELGIKILRRRCFSPRDNFDGVGDRVRRLRHSSCLGDAIRRCRRRS